MLVDSLKMLISMSCDINAANAEHTGALLFAFSFFFLSIFFLHFLTKLFVCSFHSKADIRLNNIELTTKAITQIEKWKQKNEITENQLFNSSFMYGTHGREREQWIQSIMYNCFNCLVLIDLECKANYLVIQCHTTRQTTNDYTYINDNIRYQLQFTVQKHQLRWMRPEPEPKLKPKWL